MIKRGGKFYLFDIVFSFDAAEYAARFDRNVRWTEQKVCPEMARELETHLRDEFSTHDWIMEGILERAGFRIDRADYKDGFMATYVCTRDRPSPSETRP